MFSQVSLYDGIIKHNKINAQFSHVLEGKCFTSHFTGKSTLPCNAVEGKNLYGISGKRKPNTACASAHSDLSCLCSSIIFAVFIDSVRQ